jgi:hypothetical protein
LPIDANERIAAVRIVATIATVPIDTCRRGFAVAALGTPVGWFAIFTFANDGAIIVNLGVSHGDDILDEK